MRPPTTLVCVLLCEDQEVFRIGMREVLEAEPDIAVVAETSHLHEALEAADDVRTQVVVVRQGLVAGAALSLLRNLCQRDTAVLVLAEPGTESEPELVQILQAGVRGYLPRRLFLSLATIKSHLTASMRRLDVRTRTQLAILVNRDHSPAA